MTSSKLLVHFDLSLKITLACDASTYGIGPVLSHEIHVPESSEKPAAFALNTPTIAENNYSQIEKESLACAFAVKCCHQYLPGHHFVLQMNYRPLLLLFNEAKASTPLA